jgi:hypothetical protein
LTSATRDLASHELWERSLERSRRRRELAEDARKTISRRRHASLAMSAAMATTPVVPSVIAGSMSKRSGSASTPARTVTPNSGERILLKLGAVSPSVAQLQRRLDVVDDGYFGPVTEAAVKKFQRQHNLPVTGMVDVKTWLKLFPDGMVIYKPKQGIAQMASHVPQALLRSASAQSDEAGIQSASLFTPDAAAGAAAAKAGGATKSGKGGKGVDSLGSSKGSKHKAASSPGTRGGSGSSDSRSAPASSRGSSGSSGSSVGVRPGGSTVVPKGPFKSASEMIAAMIAKANEIDSHHYAYSWGGGHNASFSGPYDCSGAVSAVLHAAGLLSRPMVSGEFMHWGRPGPGAVTLYANAGHVYMSILGHYFGTTSMNPGGGAGWFDGAPRPGFVVVHVPFEAMHLSKAELERLVAAAERRERRKHRHQGLSAASTGTTYQPVTPGYSGQVPGGTYSSTGSYTPPPDPPPAPEPAVEQGPTNSQSVGSESQVQAASTETTYDASGTASTSDSYSSGGASADGSSSGYNAESTGDSSSAETSAASVDSGSSSDGSVSSSQGGDSSSSGSSGATNASDASSGSSGSGSSSGSSGSADSGSGSSGSSGSGDSSSGSSGSGSSGAGSSGGDSSSSGASNAASSASSTVSSGASSAVESTQSAAPAAPAAPSAPAGGDSGGGAVSAGQ